MLALLAAPACQAGSVPTAAPDAGAMRTACSPRGIDVRDTGAAGDGTTDDTAAIQAAVDAAGKGGTVCVSPGVYAIRTSDGAGPTGIALPSGITIEISRGATLRAIPTTSTAYAVLRIWDAHDVTVRGGVLEGDLDRRSDRPGVVHGFGVYVRGSSDVTLDGVTARGFLGDGFYVGTTEMGVAPNQRITLRNVVADHNLRNGLSITDCSGAVVEGGSFENAVGSDPGAGIDLEPNAGSTVEDVRIDSCLLSRNQLGLMIAGGSGGQGHCSHNLAAGNVASENRGDGFFLIDVQNDMLMSNVSSKSGAAGFRLLYAVSDLVSDNLVDGSGQAGIDIQKSTDDVVEGNVVKGASGESDARFDGIFLSAGSSANGIRDNTVRAGSGQNGPRYGIRIDGPDCDANLIDANDLLRSGRPGGISDQGTATVIQNNRL